MERIVLTENTKQNRVLISYANEAYKKAQNLLSKTARKAGFTELIEYNPEDVDENFRKEHEDIFSVKRGNGLWLWKPYLILKTLESANDGDIVLYCDSGACFFRSASPLLNIADENDVWISILPLVERQFTKKCVFEKMGLMGSAYTDTPQVSGTFMAFKKTEFTVSFVKEWLKYCCDYELLSPAKDTEESDDFYSHREDQSILSLLVKKYYIRAYSDPSQYGRLPEKYIREGCEMKYYGDYPGYQDYLICILHHRTKAGNKKVILKQWLCAVLPRDVGLRLINSEGV